jgi:ATP-dependent protease ClpP protease subunit
MPNKYEIVEVSKGTQYVISIWDAIEEYGDYDKLFEKLVKIRPEDSVVLRVSTPGGSCAVGFELYDRISSVEAPIQVYVPYPTYSMGAILSLCGDALTLAEGAYMMFHDYSTGTKGKGNEIFKHSEAYSKTFEYRFNEICQPFLTKKECQDILNGKDLYVKWNDPDLEKRIKRHFK